MRMVSLLAACFAVGMTLIVHGATRNVDFSNDAVGQPPKGFEFGLTAKAGAPGKWVVQAEGDNKYLAQVDADSTRSRFPVAVVADVTAADVDLSARFKPVSGRVDQAAGLVWRFQNEDNYYIVRANALENNVVLYKVEKGKRTDLPLKGEGRTYGKKAQVPSGQWSTLRVVAAGPRFEVFFNGNKLYEVEDTTQFDDVTIVTK
jgi:3-keto-disaccharide hydrolase